MAQEKTNFIGIVLAAIAFAIVAQAIHTLGAIFSMQYYADPAYFGVWSKAMMPTAGAPPAEFFVLSLTFSFIAALMYAGAYSVVKKSIPAKDEITRGLNYGAILFLVGGLPQTLSMPLIFNLPVELVGAWAVENLVVSLIGGIIIAKLVK